MPVFAPLAEGLPRRHLPRGASVFQEGERCDGLWIVAAGSVNLLKYNPDGRFRIVETVLAGEPLAPGAAVDGGGYPAAAVTREPSALAFLPRPALLAAVRARPEVAMALARALAARLRGLTSEVAAASLQGVKERVAGYLIGEARAHGVPRPDGSIEVRLGAAQEEIAARIGTVREVLSRALRALERANLIFRRREAVVIRDLPCLTELAAA